MQAAPPLAFCTIVAKNYLAHARSLAQCLARHHPGTPFFVLLADRNDGHFDPTAEPYTVIELEELEIPNLPHFCFQYSILEMAKASKPFFLEYLFHHFECAKLIFLDPDILVFAPLVALMARLDRHSMVLTPHLTDFAAWDGKRWSELDVLRAGSFNLGLFGLANGERTRAFLDWWKERLYSGCRKALEHGMNLDQRWIDLAPGIWGDVWIERDPAYNVAHWNLHERHVRLESDRFLVNGRTLCCYHYSGYDPASPEQLAGDQNRFDMRDIGDAGRLYELYRQRLVDHGHLECRYWPYAYGAFDNGVRVPDMCRTLYVEMGPGASEFGNPFQTAGHSFYRYLIEPGQGGVPLLLREVYSRRADLQAAFPDVGGADREAFFGWAHNFAQQEFSIDPGMFSTLHPDCPAAREPSSRSSESGLDVPARALGVNLAGFFHSEKGVGEAARLVIRALEAGRIPYVLNNVQDSGSANWQSGGSVATSPDNPFEISLIQLNADQMGHFLGQRARYLEDHYNIGYWNWELSDFPPEWRASFDYFDEIWVPSTFTQESVAAVSPIPVHCVPFAVAVPAPAPGYNRRRFGLPEETFLFLFSFDFHSWLERKNPLGVIEAFRLAFGDRTDVGLVLKSVHGLARRHDWSRVHRACAGQRNIHVIDRVMDRETMYQMMALCDAYVSLHRAEGFGLGLAEMMAMGKPVIGTAYSAPLDFMNHANSMLVAYRMAAIAQSHGPYRAGFSWAEPDLNHAALCMERLVADRQAAAELGRRARADIEAELSPRRVAHLINSRLLAIGRGAISGRQFGPMEPAITALAA